MKRPLWLLIALMLALPRTAGADAVSVKTRVIPAQTTLGGEIKLVLQLEGPDGTRVQMPSDKNKLAPFELKRIEPRSGSTYTLILTAFELGELTVPAIPLAYTDASGRSGQIFSAPQKVKIVAVKRKPGDKDGEIRGIKGPVHLSLLGFWTIVGLLVLLPLTVFLFLHIYRRIRRKITEDLESKLPPHQRAERELERLQRSTLLDTGKTKEYYTELSNILRRYIERRYGIEALESTTAELLPRLKGLELDRALTDKIKDLLENADLVKFAKFSPPRTMAGDLVLSLSTVVDLTKPQPEAAPDKKGKKK